VTDQTPAATVDPGASPWLRRCSRWAIWLPVALIAATFFLISPPPGQVYPGAIPWRDVSLLRPLTELMSCNGRLATARGVEIKDFAFHLAAAAGLALLGVRLLMTRRQPVATPTPAARVAGHAQLLLAGWVLLSLASSLWSGDADISRSQALLYGLNLSWAVAVACTLDRRHLRSFAAGMITIAALAAALCVWYFYERNPHHRPGFPIGNPTVLAACLLPGTLLAVCRVGAGIHAAIGMRRPAPLVPAFGALLALVPLAWCLVLTRSRGALLALALGLAVIVVLLAGRRLRWLFGGLLVVVILAAGGALYYTSHLDVTMARGAAMRFRVYAWRYAAELWRQRPIAGHGAGAYPRLAGQLAVRDRVLDPAAFMGDLVEHAHNELFEVFSEIGLVGGVTFVAGLLATFTAGGLLLRQPRWRSSPTATGTVVAPTSPLLDLEHWYLIGVIATLSALWADSLVGVSLRLPGGPALTWTLMGVLWGLAHSYTTPGRFDAPATPRRRPILDVLRAATCFVAAAGAAWLAATNWRGVLAEQAASVAAARSDYAEALRQITRAEPRLLDPVRRILAREAAVRYRWTMASHAFSAWQRSAEVSPAPPEAVLHWAQTTYAAADELRRSVPALDTTDSLAAWAAWWLADALRTTAPADAERWRREAERAWRRQRVRTPFDVRTLLALMDYQGTLAGHLGLLRDCLRTLRTLPLDERPGTTGATAPRLYFIWLDRLRRISQVPGFDELLAEWVAAVDPLGPGTDQDALVASLAPETYRLQAAWHALRGEYAAAATACARAAELYRPLRARFPELFSIALAEQADYVLRASPTGAPQAAALLREAIAALPVIQEQKYAELVRPFRDQLTLTLLVVGQYDEAVSLLAETVGADDVSAYEVEQGLHDLLRDAALAGQPIEMLKQVAAGLCARFQSFCTPASSE